MKEGRIVKSGGVELIDLVESKGYDIFWFSYSKKSYISR
jgi:Fe-S cluster assembly ATPase SufC